MSVPTTLDDLFQLIRKSGMVDEPRLADYLRDRSAAQGPLPADPKAAADEMVRDGLLTDFQREQFLLGKWRGFTIGKYKLLERVGVGGMGQVFLAEHMHMKRRVAIKVLPPAKAEQPSALGRFYREARAAGSLEHPNIVRTHDIDQDGNLHYIVMEYVDGTNLLDLVKRFGPMPIPRAVEYIRQVAAGLEYAFRAGIIHRDVKPGNILVDRYGVAKLLDMGLARFYRDTTDNLTVQYDDKIVLGTADYVAPEQVANSHLVDTRADVYALGASLYYLLAGKPPFPEGTVSQKLLWHRTKDPAPLRQVRPEVPAGLEALVARLMKKDPSLRPQSPGEVALALEEWVTGPVPLPAAEEMPMLCPAARAVVGEPTEEEVALAATPFGGGMASRVGAGSSSRSGGFAQPSGVFGPPASRSGVFGPPTGRTPFPAAGPSQSGLTVVQTGTTAQDPTAADTQRATVPDALPLPLTPAPTGRNPLLVPLVSAMLAVLALAALVLWVSLGRG